MTHPELTHGPDGAPSVPAQAREDLLALKSGAVFACLRPEDVTLRPASGSGVVESARNRWPGRVEAAIRLEAQYRVEIDCGPRIVSLVTVQSYQDLALAPGTLVVATFKASAVHLIPR